MYRLILFTLVYILLPTIHCVAQGIAAGPGFQKFLTDNPALSGSEGDGNLRLSYNNLYPGSRLNLNSFYLSYDSYFPVLHGGAAFYITEDYLGGIVNDIKGGLSYAYVFKAGRKLYISGGLTASLFHRGYNFTNAVLPDQIDPVGGVSIPSSELLSNPGKSVFDVGAGFLFYTGKVTGGVAVNHIAEPVISESDISADRIERKFTFLLTTSLPVVENKEKKKSLVLLPLIFASAQGDYFNMGGGGSLETGNLAINTILSGDNARNMNLQAGFSFRYSIISVYYNYLFNIVSGNSLMPFSLLHQVGITFRLKNVEKRKVIKAINFPKM